MMYNLINMHNYLLMNINEKFKYGKKTDEMKYFVLPETPLWTPEFIKASESLSI